MQVGKIAEYSYNNKNSNLPVTFERRLRKDEEQDYNENAIKAALDYLGIQSVAMIMHGSCNPVTKNDMGIGSPCNEKSKEVIEFEMLHGFNSNQLGPMGEVTRGDISPYSAAVFALNSMFVDVNDLTTEKYAKILSEDELEAFRVNYSDSNKPYAYSRFFDSFENYDKLIKDAYNNFKIKVRAKDKNALKLLDEYNEFKSKKANKIVQSAIFKVLCDTYGTRDINMWESEIDRNLPTLLNKRDKNAIARYRQILNRSGEEIGSYVFGQFLVNKQLKENKEFRDKLGFEYISDNLVGNDKSEEWMYPEVFLKDYRLGCPEGGQDGPQLWDIPVLDPKKLFNKDGSLGPAGRFLKDKLEASLEYCENIRIDHALGLVDPYVYDKRSVSIVDGHLDRGRFRGNNISQIWDLDPDGNYKRILEEIVLPILKEHNITPEKAVWEDLGNQTDTFRYIYKDKLHLPGMTQLHWDRGEWAPKDNWALMGSHDEQTALSLIQNDWMRNEWDRGNHAWHIDYLSGYLNQDPARVYEREQFKQRLLERPNERVKAKFAELFLCAKRVQIPFTDFFGIEPRYNEKGTQAANNWKLRLNQNFEDDYYKNLESDNPTALNMPEILKIAVQAKADQNVVKYEREKATMNDGTVDTNRVDNYRRKVQKETEPIIKKLTHYERVLKEKSN